MRVPSIASLRRTGIRRSRSWTSRRCRTAAGTWEGRPLFADSRSSPSRWARFNLELEEAIEGPDVLVVTAVLTGESTGGSVPLAFAELRLFQQRADALAAAGLE
jgi:hypothetical protein